MTIALMASAEPTPHPWLTRYLTHHPRRFDCAELLELHVVEFEALEGRSPVRALARVLKVDDPRDLWVGRTDA